MNKISKPKTVEIPPEDIDKFVDRVFSLTKNSDDIQVILRLHLLTEHYIDEIVSLYIDYGYLIIDSERFSFWHKIKILRSLNIIGEGLEKSLEKFNTLRNNCSHVLEYCVSVLDIDRMGRPLGSLYSELKKDFGDDKRTLLEHTIIKVLIRLFTIHWAKIYEMKNQK